MILPWEDDKNDRGYAMNVTILYNPQCGTCRTVAESVKAKGHAVTLVEYLKHPPTAAELDAICRKLGKEPQDIAREKEAAYAKLAAQNLDRAGWLQALHDYPQLMQRPIVVAGNRAIIARPAETIDSFLY